MVLSHHPSAEMRSDYRIGNLAPGAALTVAAHLALCRECALVIGDRPREIGFAHPSLQATGRRRRSPAVDPPPERLPRVLRDIPLGKWRWVGPGVRVNRLQGVSGIAESVHLLRVSAGARFHLPAAHVLLVLSGAIATLTRQFGPGAFLELADLPSRKVRADTVAGCLCLVVGEDDLYRGLLGRLAH
jgi:anti-sigma factor ChrR (cupin superfamily)